MLPILPQPRLSPKNWCSNFAATLKEKRRQFGTQERVAEQPILTTRARQNRSKVEQGRVNHMALGTMMYRVAPLWLL